MQQNGMKGRTWIILEFLTKLFVTYQGNQIVNFYRICSSFFLLNFFIIIELKTHNTRHINLIIQFRSNDLIYVNINWGNYIQLSSRRSHYTLTQILLHFMQSSLKVTIPSILHRRWWLHRFNNHSCLLN